MAVLDSGIDGSHDAFCGKTTAQKDFTGKGDGDNNGHGTHCAGTISAEKSMAYVSEWRPASARHS